MNKYLKFKYRNECNLGGIPYSDLADLYLYIYLDGEIVQPEHELVEEGEEDGYKNFIPTMKKTAKTYTIRTEVQPEHALDALQMMKLHDEIYLITKNGEEQRIYNVMIENEYPFDDSYGTALITFDMGEIAYTNTCCG